MNPYKKLSGQALIYGLGNIVPRVLNYTILTFYYTRKFSPQEYGIVTELYAYVAVLLILLTYGMETGLFKFSTTNKDNNTVFTTALISVAFTSLLFIVLIFYFKSDIAFLLNYKNNPEYIIYLSMAVAMDAIASIFFAKLRIDNKVRIFAILKIVNVLLTLAAVFIFLELLPNLNSLKFNSWYNLHLRYIGVGYIFISNTIASFIILLLLSFDLVYIKIRFNNRLLIDLLFYSVPLLIAGLAGILNETIDRILLPRLLSKESNALYELGIYGANFRIAVLMTIFVQMFRYAAEPFFFNMQNQSDSKKIYANILKYFTIFLMIIFLTVALEIDIFKYFIGSDYYEGLKIVPIILLSNVFIGLLFNVNMWYKLSGHTMYGAYITICGAFLTIILNTLFIPKYSYYACAWIHLLSNFVMLLLTYYLGQKKYRIPYDIKNILKYIIYALVLYLVGYIFRSEREIINIIVGLTLILVYIIYCNSKEKLIYIFLNKNEN